MCVHMCVSVRVHDLRACAASILTRCDISFVKILARDPMGDGNCTGRNCGEFDQSKWYLCLCEKRLRALHSDAVLFDKMKQLDSILVYVGVNIFCGCNQTPRPTHYPIQYLGTFVLVTCTLTAAVDICVVSVIRTVPTGCIYEIWQQGTCV